MKAISTIIATIILVVISISLVGTAYLFVSGLLTGQTSKNIKLMEASGHIVIIQNIGTQNITSNDIRVLVNGGPRDIINPQTIKPGDAAALKFIPPNFGNELKSANVIVVGPSNSLNYRIDFIPHEPKVTSGTVGLWHFNENTGTTATDSSSNHNDGTLMNGPNWIDGKFGRGLQFDGSDDYVTIPDSSSLDGMGELTLSCWMKFNEFTLGDAYPCIGKHEYSESYELDVIGDKRMEFCVANDTAPCGPGCNWECNTLGPQNYFTTNKWYLIVATYNSFGEKHIYVYDDSGQKLSYTITSGIIGTIRNNIIPVQIGNSNDPAEQYRKMNGTIDEVVIYNRALTQEEILDSIYG